MFEFRTNMSSWFWRIWVSGMVALEAFFFLKVEMQYALVLWLVLSILNFLLISDSKMEKIMGFLFSKKFLTCLLCVITAGLVATAILLLYYFFYISIYGALPDNFITIISYLSFFAYLGLIFLVKYLKKDHTKLCLKPQI